MRRRPEPRDLPPRSSDNEKRALREELPSAEERLNLAQRAWYEGYGKHKRNPYLWNVAPYHGQADDRTYCEDSGFALADEARIPDMLRRGIYAGLFGDQSENGNPTILWTIDETGWIYELRLTNRGQALYHGYPLLLNDAMARKVISRFEKWTFQRDRSAVSADPTARLALREAHRLYS